MADIYVRSTDGSDSDDGSTWALAKATLTGAAAIDAAGDRIYVSQNHAFSQSAALTYNWAGTLANPVKIICANDSADPPTAEATGASETVVDGTGIGFVGAFVCRGMRFKVGRSGVSAQFSFCQAGDSNQAQIFQNCTFENNQSGSGTGWTIGSSSFAVPALAVFENCNFYPSGTSSNRGFFAYTGSTIINGGGYDPASPAASQLVLQIGQNGRAASIEISGFNLSVASGSVSLFPSSGTGTGKIRNCRLPPAWSGGLTSGEITQPGYRVEMYNCDGAGTNHRLWIADAFGAIRESAAVCLAGTRVAGTPISHRFESSARCNFASGRLYGPEMHFVITPDMLGRSVTATIEVALDSASALTDDECWLELMFPGAYSHPLGTWVSGAKANILAAGAAHASSSETWLGVSGWANLQRRKLQVTFTPRMTGMYPARVVLGKANTTLYVDPDVRLA